MPNEKPFKLDMPFEEALRRFSQTDVNELPEGVRLRKPRRKQIGEKQEGRGKPDPPNREDKPR